MGKYKYLQKYSNQNKKRYAYNENHFRTLFIEDIEAEEKRLGFRFPEQLREFWLEIGYGSIRVGAKTGPDWSCPHHNSILRPDQIADILLSNEDDPNSPVLPEFYELLRPGYMPFFEIGDSISFLYMRPQSDNPNAIWYGRDKICDSFEEFIHRLYYESPTFYCEDEPKEKSSKAPGANEEN